MKCQWFKGYFWGALLGSGIASFMYPITAYYIFGYRLVRGG